MQDKYCLPIMKPATAEVLATLQEQTDSYRYFEVWLDYLADLDNDFIQSLIEQWPDRIILVFRRQQLAPMQLPLERRLGVIRLCHGQPVLVDLDLDSQQAELKMVTKENLTIKTILSYHNYDTTPAQAELGRLVRRMLASKPYMLKIAAFCNSPEDCVRLLSLLLRLRAKKQRCVILGMGGHGLATRLFGTLWANELIFAPVATGDQSAPGQLTRQQLDVISNIIQGKEYHGRQ